MASLQNTYPQNLEEFHDAVKRCDVEMVEGVDIKLLNGGDDHGFTAMMWAAWLGHVTIGKTLLDLGADVTKRDTDGQDALFHACWQGESRFASLLLQHNADPSTADVDGESALMAAAHKGHANIASLLVEHGADIVSVDRNNMTAKDHAIKWGHYDELKTLLEPLGHVKTMVGRYEKEEAEPEMETEGPIRVTVRGVPESGSVDRSSSPGVSHEDPTTEATETEHAETERATTEPHDDAASPREHSAGTSEFASGGSVGTSPPPAQAINLDPRWVEVEIASYGSEDDVDVDDVPMVGSDADEVEELDVAMSPHGLESCVRINLWRRRHTAKLQVETVVEEDDDEVPLCPEDEEALAFKQDVARFLDSFPPVETGCTVCDVQLDTDEDMKLIYCADCQETLCSTCWKNEHQNKKRRHHAPRPAVNQDTRFEAVAQVAVQLSRVLEKTERHRDQALYEHSQAHQLNSVLVQELESERTRRRQADKDHGKMEAKLREINNLLHSRDAKYQAYIKDLQARHAAEKHSFHMKEAELRRQCNHASNELSEAKRLFSLREAEYKLQNQTATMRAQRASSHVEQSRIDMIRIRSENERAREEAERARHRLDVERMKSQRYEEENRRLLRQIHRMMPEFEQRRSKSEYTFPNGSSNTHGTSGAGAGADRTHNRSGTNTGYDYFRSSAPPPPQDGIRASLAENIKEGLRKVKKYGLADVDNSAVDVLHSGLSSITIHEAWIVVGVAPYTKGAHDVAKKLLTKLHPDRTQQAAMKETLRKRFQIVNHSRALIIEKTDK